MTRIEYSALNKEGSFDILIEGVKVGTLTCDTKGKWTAFLPASGRKVTRSSLDAIKTWVYLNFD